MEEIRLRLERIESTLRVASRSSDEAVRLIREHDEHVSEVSAELADRMNLHAQKNAEFWSGMIVVVTELKGLVGGLQTVVGMMRESLDANKLTERERQLFRLLLLTVIALIVMAFGKAGVEAAAEFYAKMNP